MFLYFNTDAPNTVMNVRIMNITGVSFVVLWDEVMDIFTITYNVTWYDESGIIGMDTVNSPPYNVTGLTAHTPYNVTVVAINTCCGAGPASDIIIVMTNGNVLVKNIIIINCISINKPSCMYTHTCIHTRTYIYIYTRAHIHIHTCTHMHKIIRTHTDAHAQTYTHAYTCIHNTYYEHNYEHVVNLNMYKLKHHHKRCTKNTVQEWG